MFIVIEGPDAVGKETQTELLFRELSRRFEDGRVCRLNFPRYETRIGRLISETLMQPAGKNSDRALLLQSLMAVDKYAAAPQLSSFQFVGACIVDRWVHSAMIYGAQDGLDEQWLKDLHSSLPAPSVHILLDLPAELARERLLARAKAKGLPLDRYERDPAQPARLRAAYRAMWKQRPFTGRWHIVDAAGLAQDVHERVVMAVESRR